MQSKVIPFTPIINTAPSTSLSLSLFNSTMASSSFFTASMFALVFLTTLLSNAVISHQQPVLNSAEQDSVYRVLDSINPNVPWRSFYPDDLCTSPPYGVVCDYFSDSAASNDTDDDTTQTPHITELRFGYVSDYTPNPPCTPNSTIHPSLFTSFPYLRKIFFYQCFTGTHVSVPGIPSSFGSDLEELVFIDNPSLVGPLGGVLRNFTGLKRLVLTGNGFSGNFPDVFSELVNLQEVTVSANRLNGDISSVSFDKMKKLKVLDLSHSDFEGDVPDSIGRLTELLKLDLSYNRFTGKIPDGIKGLQRLELLDLSFNRFGNFGVPLFLAEMPSLRQVHLSGNLLGGAIPEIWKNMGGILGLGLSGMGLVGNIPNSMGLHLRSLRYLGLDNNKLEGIVPLELGMLENVGEVNLQNNSLSGKIPFTAKFTARVGKKLKLGGNPELCADEVLLRLGGKKSSDSLGHLKICKKPDIPNPVLLHGGPSSSSVQLQLSSQNLLMSLVLLFGSLLIVI